MNTDAEEKIIFFRRKTASKVINTGGNSRVLPMATKERLNCSRRLERPRKEILFCLGEKPV
jgi:hypothetical protein